MSTSTAKQILILGGTRSGKSRFAEQLALQETTARTYIATAQPIDAEMETRIQAHTQRRGTEWNTIEAPLALAEAIAQHSQPQGFLLVDCLTLWLSNLLLQNLDLEEAVSKLLQSIQQAQGTLVLVGNEVGMGIVPETPLGRRFRDEAGILNQKVAGLCAEVFFVCAGIPLQIKG